MKLFLILLFVLTPFAFSQENFEKDKLVAWCIVPFDAKNRNPEQRAQMVKKLGLKRVAYDWRQKHVKEFEEEILAYKKHGIEYFAFWSFHPEMAKLIQKHNIKPQFWIWVRDNKKLKDQKGKVEVAAKSIESQVIKAQELGCKVALYNHGGWTGEPKNLVAVVKWFHERGMKNVGIVYNFHHGHDIIKKFTSQLKLMKPYLFCLILNGMNLKANPKILAIGKGKYEKEMIKSVIESGYTGPIGILDHVQSRDSEEVLLENLKGLEKVTKEISKEKKESAYLYKDGKIWKEPFNTNEFKSHTAFINRDRVYNFYAKQARYFGPKKDVKRIPAFIGLDSGKGYHWGNQNDKVTWQDGRANEMKFGSMVSGIIRGKNFLATKGYSIQLSENTYVIFDAENKKFVKAWKGDPLSWSPVRFGLIRGLSFKGTKEIELVDNGKSYKEYKGFYRVGNRVIFALDNSYVEAFVEKDKVSIKEVEKPKAGESVWKETVHTKGELGSGKPYAYDTFTIPFKNPYNSLFFVGGLDVLSKDRIAICTMHGDVWICDVKKEDFSELSWKRFAAGLHQPLGLKVKDDIIHVMCRDQIVALHDLNNDDEADFYECVSNSFKTSAGGHDYITGLQLDNQGRWYMASGNQGVCQIDEKTKKVNVLGSGLRNPNGLGINDDASVILTSVQEGSWTPASAICDMSQGDHFGHGGPKNGKYTEPMLYLPRGIDNSSGGQAYINSDKWGPVKGQWVHFSMGYATQFLMLREVIDGKSQAAAFVIPGEFKAGAHRGRFSPYDGQLYVAGSKSWGNYGVDDGSVQRVRFTDGSYPYPSSYETRENGIILHFAESQAKEIATKDLWFAQHWNYRFSGAYGSKEYSIEEPMKKGHDRLEIRSVQYLEKGKKIFLEIPQIQSADQLHLYFNGKTKLEAFATIHQLGKAFTKFPGYTKIIKVYGKALDASALSDPKILIQACSACHHPSQRVVGPSFKEIRKMYANNPAGIVKWAKNPQVKNPQLPPMPSFKFMKEETLLKIAKYILEERK